MPGIAASRHTSVSTGPLSVCARLSRNPKAGLRRNSSML